MSFKEFSQPVRALVFRIDDQEEIVVTLPVGGLFTLKMPVRPLTQGFYTMDERMDRAEDGKTAR